MSYTDINEADLAIEADVEEYSYDYDTTRQIPEIVTPDDMTESGYQEGSENSFGDRRDSKEAFAEGDSDSGVDGGVSSSGCSTADDCPVVSVNDVVAYYDDIRPRRRHVPPLNFYHLDVERMALDTAQVSDLFYLLSFFV